MSRRNRHPVFDARDPLLDDDPVAVIDLHGLTGAEAAKRVSNELATLANRHKGQVVAIITGRGAHSNGPAVLGPLVGRLLKGSLSRYVGRCEKTLDGGAYRVQIR